MPRLIRVAAVVCALALTVTAAEARPHHHYRHHHHSRHVSDARPSAWCGWYMRKVLGVSDRVFNVARAWARYGSPASGPQVGAIVVWPHHVGLITGRSSNGWVVKSGNDGHRVRERVRSLRGAIAFRIPHQHMASR